MIKLTVLYHHRADPDAFARNDEDVHAPLVGTLPLEGFHWGRVLSLADGSPAPYFWSAGLFFADAASMAAVLGTEQGQAVSADVTNFAPDGPALLLVSEST